MRTVTVAVNWVVIAHGVLPVGGADGRPTSTLKIRGSWVVGIPAIAYEVKGPKVFRGGFENLKVAARVHPWVKFYLVWEDGAGGWAPHSQRTAHEGRTSQNPHVALHQGHSDAFRQK